ncbi:GDSL-type esterase/lipase family protein [Chitinophaga sp.]|uniref:GDSL-type esterase/lipase family protein n=1 Tax=Chitinophaga sp. TaxID=1869181 RepID=UPI0031E1DCE0
MKTKRITLLLTILMTGIITARAQYSIVFIGNSITHGATLSSPALECPPVQTVKLLQAKGHTVKFANCGYSGSTTVDFLPASRNLFPKVLQAADTLYDPNVWLIFSISLGTNDSAIEGPTGAPVSPGDYSRNLQVIIDSLHNRYPHSIFVLHRPIWYSPNTYNRSKYLAAGLSRLQTYTPQLDKLVKENPDYIFKGDRNAYDFFRKDPDKYFTAEKGNAGIFFLHPNALGAEKLGGFWANNLANTIEALYRNSVHKQVGHRAY